jgi:hypothetical protein
MIPQRNISLLSNRLASEGGRRIPEAVLERDYCLAWFLVGLSSSPICKSFRFRRGTLLVLLVLFFSCFMMIHMINIFCSMGIFIYLYSAKDPHRQAQTK